MDAKTKVSRAITKLMIQYPFYGSLALSSEVYQDDSIPTMCTDGKSIRWSGDFVDELEPQHVLFVIAHEVMHIALMHPLRIGEREPERWNIACDYAINAELIEIFGVDAMPKGGLFDPQYLGKSAEQVYMSLPNNLDDITGGGQAWDFGGIQEPRDNQGQKLQPSDIEELEAEITQKTLMAADAAKAVGKLPSSVEELVNIMKRSQVDLETVVSKFVGGDQPNDYSYRRINKRDYTMYGMINRTITNNSVGHTVVAIDSSASVTTEEQQYFLGLVNHFIEEKKPESVTIMTWDVKVQTVNTYQRGEPVPEIGLTGRGGTLVQPVFNYIESENIPCDQMIVLSDMQIFDFPERPARYPVLWVSSWLRSQPAPWGKSTWMKAA